jgi:hypothetical protein
MVKEMSHYFQLGENRERRMAHIQLCCIGNNFRICIADEMNENI